MKFNDLITRLPALLDEEDTVKEAILLMQKTDVSVLPVTRDRVMAGTVTARDILSCESALNPDACIDQLRDKNYQIHAHTKIKEIMDPKGMSVHLGDAGSVAGLISFLKGPLHCLPVTDSKNRVLGFIKKEALLKKASDLTAWESLSFNKKVE